MDEYQKMLEAAEWSDRFFNGDWTPSLTSEHIGDEVACDYICREASREFLRLFPECPYDEDWLIKDFLRRL